MPKADTVVRKCSTSTSEHRARLLTTFHHFNESKLQVRTDLRAIPRGQRNKTYLLQDGRHDGQSW